MITKKTMTTGDSWEKTEQMGCSEGDKRISAPPGGSLPDRGGSELQSGLKSSSLL